MKRAGTVSAAAGLIFLGVWMIASRSNPDRGAEIFKWWPVLIVLLGLEILITIGFGKFKDIKPGINMLVIPVFMIFVVISLYHNITDNIYSFMKNNVSLDSVVRLGDNFDKKYYKELRAEKLLEGNVSRLQLDSNNIMAEVHKSADGKIKLVMSIFVDKEAPVSSYNANVIKITDGYRISISEDYIKKVRIDLYVPDGKDIIINTQNTSIISHAGLDKTNYDVKCSNINLNLTGGQKLNLVADSCSADIDNVSEVNINSGSGKTVITGDTRKMNLSIDNGTLDVNNKICSSVNVSMESGVVNFITKDKNVTVNTELDSGVCHVNNEKRINSGIQKVLGNGTGKLGIKLSSGNIKFSSQE